MFTEIFENVQSKKPMVHCITNYVTVNDCANALLACGASPIMADDEGEVEEITSICSALDINIGTLNQRTVTSMFKAGRKANELQHPVVLDPVGAGASLLRTSIALKLIEGVRFSVIRGNISEIMTIGLGNGSTKGVDADISDSVTEETIDDAIRFLKKLSWQTGAVIVVTGAIDIASDGSKAYIVRNGHSIMSKITGTGCMLSAMIAAFCGANPNEPLKASAAALTMIGLSGELAYEKLLRNNAGTSTYRNYLIDEISKMDTDGLIRGAKIEVR